MRTKKTPREEIKLSQLKQSIKSINENHCIIDCIFLDKEKDIRWLKEHREWNYLSHTTTKELALNGKMLIQYFKRTTITLKSSDNNIIADISTEEFNKLMNDSSIEPFQTTKP